MIALIEGTLIACYTSSVIVQNHGIGYEVHIPPASIAEFPPQGEKVRLYTVFIVREDEQSLYGFIHKDQQALFRILLKASGIGPKSALNILSAQNVETFVTAIHEHDLQQLIRLPGIGHKSAERLVVELRDRLKNWTTPTSKSHFSEAFREAEEALINLGYSNKEIHQSFADMDCSTSSDSASIIRQVLARYKSESRTK